MIMRNRNDMTTTTTTTTSSYLRSMYSMIVILILSMSILTSDNSNAIIPTVDGFVVVDSMAINRNNNWKKSMIGRATHRHHPRRRLWGWNDNMDDNKDDKNYRDALTLNRARTDIRHFLTQRSIQSFQFLLISCRDDVTSQWIENTYELENMEQYHGTGGYNLTKYPRWDSLLNDMVARPEEIIIIYAKRRGAGQGGWSKNNPYLQERFVEFPITITPVSLVTRLLAVREQIANEWIYDLQLLSTINDMILTAYQKQQYANRNIPSSTATTMMSSTTTTITNETATSTTTAAVSSTTSKSDKPIAYDRSHMQFMGNMIDSSMSTGSSPYRKGTFDLLALLATQESIHRVLRQYKNHDNSGKPESNERDVSFVWLRQFYIERVRTFFDGNQNYGRADDFLEELLLSVPRLIEMDTKVNYSKSRGSSSNSPAKTITTMGFIDPLRIAEDILAMRTQVYQDWRQTIQTVPAVDHTNLRRTILSIQTMGTTTTTNMESFSDTSDNEDEKNYDDIFFQ